MKLSIVVITKNAGGVIEGSLKSIEGLWDELLVDDHGSTDETREIVEKYGGKIISSENKNLGERKQLLIEKAKGDWVLLLDSDERVSKELCAEIKKITKGKRSSQKKSHQLALDTVGYQVPYQNYVFGKPVNYGGEKYSKIRLFAREYGRVSPFPIHEEVIVSGPVSKLSGVIYHHSYRTLTQLFIKFTRYAWIASLEKKKIGEKVSAKKLFFYGPHMFWTRFINERGYKDGWRGLVLAFAFAYMEGLTYAMLLRRQRS